MKTLPCEPSEQSPRADQPSCRQGGTGRLPFLAQKTNQFCHSQARTGPSAQPREFKNFQGLAT